MKNKFLRSESVANRKLKIVVLGDGSVGKDFLCLAYQNSNLPNVLQPSIFNIYEVVKEIDKVVTHLEIWVVAGHEGIDRIRPLAYLNTDCFILCYSSDNKSSFANVGLKWMPEIRQYQKKTPVVLVATKSDLQINPIINSADLIAEAEGELLAQHIKAQKFIQCSVFKDFNIEKVFEEAVKASCEESLKKKEKKVKKLRHC